MRVRWSTLLPSPGTNQFHGDVWEFNREGSLAARNFFATPTPMPRKPTYLQNQFGGAAGGPIIRDKLFIFGFYEGFRVKDGTATRSMCWFRERRNEAATSPN